MLLGGDDIGAARAVFVHEAVELCTDLPQCVGITYNSASGVPNETVLVYFKSRFRSAKAEGWWSVAVRAEHRDYKHLAPLRPFISADYDYDVVARYGTTTAKARALWPEYNAPLSRAPAFHYPSPAAVAVPVSLAPRVYLLPDILSERHAGEIIAAAKEGLVDSRVVKNGKAVKEERKSFGRWLADDVEAVKVLQDRIETATGVLRARFERLEVLRHSQDQHEAARVDYFHPDGYGRQGWNRMATVITFLSNVSNGGEVSFPAAHSVDGREKRERGADDCATGLRIRPLLGTAVLFYSMRQSHNFDPLSIHAGCPVQSDDEKWVAVQWLRLQLPEDGPQPQN